MKDRDIPDDPVVMKEQRDMIPFVDFRAIGKANGRRASIGKRVGGHGGNQNGGNQPQDSEVRSHAVRLTTKQISQPIKKLKTYGNPLKLKTNHFTNFTNFNNLEIVIYRNLL